jgi:transcriptional repressor NrdR
MAVRCPYCDAEDDRVIDSRATEDGGAIRRRRVCQSCNQRFSTYERVEQAPLRVCKRGGTVEPFDREKVAKGIARATKNLALEPGAVRRAVAKVEGRLRDANRREVTSAQVGAEVLQALRELHEVAYVRFASVHKSFTSPADFERELQQLQDERPASPNSPAADAS